jgi:hypothetical protein
MKSRAILSLGLALAVFISACAPTGTPTPQAGSPLQSIGQGEGSSSKFDGAKSLLAATTGSCSDPNGSEAA